MMDYLILRWHYLWGHLEGNIEYHLLVNKDKGKYLEIFWDSEHKMVIYRSSRMKKNNFKISTKHSDELPTDPIQFIKSQIESKINEGYTDIFQ